MAEFQDVMRQRNRMCKMMESCQDCALLKNYVYDCKAYMICKPDEVEKIIMDWASAHPEPTYPTWKEWQRDTFPGADIIAYPCAFISKEQADCRGKTCEACRNMPIPADIAEKLGIKPREVE